MFSAAVKNVSFASSTPSATHHQHKDGDSDGYTFADIPQIIAVISDTSQNVANKMQSYDAGACHESSLSGKFFTTPFPSLVTKSTLSQSQQFSSGSSYEQPPQLPPETPTLSQAGTPRLPPAGRGACLTRLRQTKQLDHTQIYAAQLHTYDNLTPYWLLEAEFAEHTLQLLLGQQPLGTGAYSKVVLAVDVHAPNATAYACKIYPATLPSLYRQSVSLEEDILRELQYGQASQSAAAPFGAFAGAFDRPISATQPPSAYFLLMPLMQTSLYNVYKKIDDLNDTTLREALAAWVVWRPATQLSLLHRQALQPAHRDVHLKNFLVDLQAPAQVHLSDFNLSGPAQQQIENTQNPFFMPPECLKEDVSPTPAGDCWALGALLLLFATDRLVFFKFHLLTPDATRHALEAYGEVLEMIEHYRQPQHHAAWRDLFAAIENPSLRHLCEQALQLQPEQRASAASIAASAKQIWQNTSARVRQRLHAYLADLPGLPAELQSELTTLRAVHKTLQRQLQF